MFSIKGYGSRSRTPGYHTGVPDSKRLYSFRNMANVSLLEQSRLSHPGSKDSDHVVAMARCLIDELGLVPPIDALVVASAQGISRVEPCQIPWAACLLTEADRLVVKVRVSDSNERQRFSIFHECIHTFLPGFAYEHQYRCEPATRPHRRDPVESLCDLGASELLLPQSYISADLAKSQLDFLTIQDIARRYGASVQASAHRAVELWPEDALFLSLERIDQNHSPEAGPVLRLTSFHRNGRWPFIPVGRDIIDPLLTEALSSDIAQISPSFALLPRGLGPLNISAQRFPYYDASGRYHMRLLVIIRKVTQRAARFSHARANTP
jgi:hypothetical protein